MFKNFLYQSFKSFCFKPLFVRQGLNSWPETNKLSEKIRKLQTKFVLPGGAVVPRNAACFSQNLKVSYNSTTNEAR
jgi:hypothetical protein